MGDPTKVILLEALVLAIKEMDLLDSVTVVGHKMLEGLTQLQVSNNVFVYFFPNYN